MLVSAALLRPCRLLTQPADCDIDVNGTPTKMPVLKIVEARVVYANSTLYAMISDITGTNLDDQYAYICPIQHLMTLEHKRGLCWLQS